MMRKALVVLSGGQDSTTCLFWALKEFDSVKAITFDYGQSHRIEIDSAKKIAAMASVKHEVIEVPDCLVSTSPLTNNGEGLERYESAEQMEQVIGDRREATFVPMRNALFLTIAANRAESWGMRDIVTGVCQMDNANYDDCRQVFIDDAQKYINSALGYDHRGLWRDRMQIWTPLMNLSKAETVLLARGLPGCWEALAYSHTSYDGKYPPTDPNHANVLRAQGFLEAGWPDPLVLRAVDEGLMEMPATPNYSTAQLRRLRVKL